ncbi:MAG TPA: PRC-barrel domain-containing protein [Bacillota bacterium]|nr:PRC-barrel domain-containing protein [Bacillota bacterium]
MKSNTLLWTALAMATALSAQAALAQESDTNSTSQAGQTDQTAAQPANQPTAAQPAGASATDIRLSKLKGAEVKSNAGETLGKMEDLVIDPQTGKIRFAILGRGGVLGMGAKHVPVPWQAVTVQSEKQFTLNVDKQKLQTAPTVKSDYSDLQNPEYVVNVYKFYEIQPAIGAPGETPGGMGTGTGQSPTNSAPSNP